MTNAEKAIKELISTGYLTPGQAEIKEEQNINKINRFIVIGGDPKKKVKFTISSGEKEIKRGIKRIIKAKCIKQGDDSQVKMALD